MVTSKNVTVIPATLNMHTGTPKITKTKRKVAGYARVSTDSDEQFTSYEAQVDYYTNYIQNNLEWEFVKVYTDEGISALSTKNREGFNMMISDALGGKIDLIITKSVSRFARNTVDSLTTVRRLKDKGVEVYFEKENIWTMDSKGELLITIMSSLAQEESRSISENVTWGQRNRYRWFNIPSINTPRDEVVMLPIDALHDYPNQPFRTYSDEKLDELVEDIKINGVLSPIIVRKRAEGGWQILAGHNRKRASRKAGRTELPCIIKNVSDDEAIILAIDSNIQREIILPSEKAWAYRFKMEALKRQGKRTDLTLSQIETKLNSGAELAKESNDSRAQIYKY
ncbi:MAG: recombinase family protein, partial [Oscillospiraceae bacterium]|nr:recombinase family protein [Oscillospiraceae bacterium]